MNNEELLVFLYIKFMYNMDNKRFVSLVNILLASISIIHDKVVTYIQNKRTLISVFNWTETEEERKRETNKKLIS